MRKIFLSILLCTSTLILFNNCDRSPFSLKDPELEAKNEKNPRYLSFQVFTYGPNKDPLIAYEESEPEKQISEVTEAIGTTGDSYSTQLAFSFGPITFDHSDDDIRKIIQDSFALGLKYDVAISLHLDDSMMWMEREDLHSNIDNVEWSDWDKTPIAERTIGWLKTQLAPPMCYESPDIRQEAKRIAKDVIGAEVIRQLAELERQDKMHLFAGVIAGWETRLDDDFQPRSPTGFCSLTHKGFSKDNPPADIDVELVTIVKDWAALWTDSLAEAGLPREKLFTHIALPESIELQNQVHAPYSVAENDSSYPGYSIYSSSLRLILGDSMSSVRQNPWINSEGTNISLEDAFDTETAAETTLPWETFLAAHYNYGSTMLNLFGWQTYPNKFGVVLRSDEAVAAYQKFLNGEPLSEDGLLEFLESESVNPIDLATEFQERMEQLQPKVVAFLEAGGDINAIQPLLDEIQSAVEDDDLERALSIIDEIESLLIT